MFTKCICNIRKAIYTMKYDKTNAKILQLATILCLCKLGIFPLLGFFWTFSLSL